jgi:spore maturation protein CgeB
MRLIRITTDYPVYLNRFYRSHPQLKEQAYSVQYNALVDDCFAWADFWTHALNKLGYEAWEPVGNAESQQKAWAHEHGIAYDENNWLTDIITAQVKDFQPDILFVTDYHTYKREFLDHLRSVAPSIRLVIGWCGAPYTDASVFNAYDLVLSNITSLVEHFRSNGHRSEQMLHAFDPRVLNKIQRRSQKTIPFSFVGSIFKAETFHNEREKLVRYLVRHSGLQIWSDIQVPQIEEYRELVKLKNKFIAMRRLRQVRGGNTLTRILPQYRDLDSTAEPDISNYVAFEIAEKASPGLYGLAMYQLLHDSKLTFNNHIDISAQFANNLRLYEATGVGTCLLTDWKGNLSDIFEPDIEVVTYRSADEAADKVRYLLAHDDERRQIAEAGQRRTLRDHTFDLRAQQLDELIRRMGKEISRARSREA